VLLFWLIGGQRAQKAEGEVMKVNNLLTSSHSANMRRVLSSDYNQQQKTRLINYRGRS